MPSIGSVLVEFRADLAQFQSSMTAARQQIAGVQQSAAATQTATSQMAQGFNSLATAVSTAGEAFLAFVSIRAIEGFLTDAAEATKAWAEQLEKLQNLAGVTSQAAGVLAASVKLTGVDTDTVTQAMARLGTVLSQHPEKFQQLGISIRDANGQLLPLTTILRNTVAGLDEFKAGSDRVAAAGLLFGRQSQIWLTQLQKLAPALSDANWSQTAALVNGLGLSMDDARARAEEWNRTLGTLQLAMLGVKAQVGDALLPMLTSLAAEITVLAENGQLKLWAEEGTRAILSLGIAVLQVTDIIAQHNLAIALALSASGTMSVMSGNVVTGLAMIAAAWKMTGTAGDKAAADASASAEKMIAAMTKARDAIGSMPNAPALGATSVVEGNKSFNVPSAEEKKAAELAATFKRTYDDLIATFNNGTQAQNALAASYAQGNLATDQARISAAGLAAVQKVLAEAERTKQQVTADGLRIAQDAAEAEERAKIGAQDNKAVHDALTTAIEEYNQKLLDEKTKVEDLIDPMKKVRDEQALWTDELNRGLISQDEYAKGMTAIVAASKDQTKATDQIVSAVRSGSSRFLDELIKIGQTKDPIAQLGETFLGLAQDIEKAIFEVLVLDPLLKSLKDTLNSSGGVAGGFGGLFSSIMGMFGGGGGAAAAGGDTGGLSMDMFSADMFMASGAAVVGEHGPEVIMPLARAADGSMGVRTGSSGASSAAPNIVINNNHSSADVSTSMGPNGKDIIVQIDEAMAYRVGMGRSRLATVMQQSGMSNPRTPITR